MSQKPELTHPERLEAKRFQTFREVGHAGLHGALGLEKGCLTSEWVQALGEHRLWPVASELHEQGLLSADLAQVCEKLSLEQQARLARIRRIEELVLTHLAGMRVLVLKGAALARLDYTRPDQRLRTDLDILVDEAALDEVLARLLELGYQPKAVDAASSTQRMLLPGRESQVEGLVIDLHWRLSHHLALSECMPWNDLWTARRSLPGHEGAGVAALGRCHALLHGAVHFHGHHRRTFRPLQWVLDIDRLWRACTEKERELAVGLAERYRLSALLADMLKRSARAFGTPVEASVLTQMHAAGKKQPSRWLVRRTSTRWQEFAVTFLSAGSLKARIELLRHRLALRIFRATTLVRRIRRGAWFRSGSSCAKQGSNESRPDGKPKG